MQTGHRDAVPPDASLSAGLLPQAIGAEVGPVRQPALEPADARPLAVVDAQGGQQLVVAHRVEHPQDRRLGALDLKPPGHRLRQPLLDHIAWTISWLGGDELPVEIVNLDRDFAAAAGGACRWPAWGRDCQGIHGQVPEPPSRLRRRVDPAT